MIQTLKGIKVVDMTIAGAGPTGGRILAEYGLMSRFSAN